MCVTPLSRRPLDLALAIAINRVQIKLYFYWLTGLRSDAAAASSAARNAGSIRTANCSLLLICFAIPAASRI